MSSPVLPQAAGYGVVIGMGMVFSLVMLGVTRLQARYTSHVPTSSEEFSSASRSYVSPHSVVHGHPGLMFLLDGLLLREKATLAIAKGMKLMNSVPPGLIAAGIVSAWTWAATLLQSSATAYKFGISGPWWYASGATIQILLFAMIASKLKQNAPNCHTYLEIMRVRWGKAAHLTFLFFGLATNIIVSTMLILGGSATVTDLTGMHTVAACFLIPLGVSIYVLAGGMRATLIADWSHTLVLYCILIAFALTVYATSDKLGSPTVVWNHLHQASVNHPVEGNAEGSYLTMRSKSGLIFGVMNIVGNFGTVFADQAYFQRAIASSPSTSVKAFLLGGLAWFGIPMGIATSMGLAAVALARGDNPIMSLTPSEVSAGLPAVKAAAALMGQSGAVAMLILLFLAVTSACSAEQIAVSSLFTYDVYGQYVNKNASDKQLLWAGRGAIVGCSIMMGVFATAFHYIGVSMGYLYELMGTMIGSAVVPIAVCITWRRANGTGAVAGAILGFVAGVAGWLGLTASLNGGVVNVDTTFGDYEMLTGNLLAIGVGGIVTVAWSLISPCDFDWEATRAINKKVVSSEVEVREPRAAESPSLEGEAETPGVKESKEQPGLEQQVALEIGVETLDGMDEAERRDLQKAFRFAAWSALVLVFVLIFAIPLPLFFSSYVYPAKGFAAWVSISIIWLFTGLLLVGVYPVWEARKGLLSVWQGLMSDVREK